MVNENNENKKTEMRADCPYCGGILALRNSGDGEWICDKCKDVFPLSIVSRNKTKMVEVKEALVRADEDLTLILTGRKVNPTEEDLNAEAKRKSEDLKKRLFD